jgi:hypothetical protein
VLGLGRLVVDVCRPGGSDGDGDAGRPATLSDRELRLVLAGLVPAVVLGEAYFWGTWNGLENGLIDLLGPYYHFDLLVPAATFAAVSLVRIGRRARAAVAPRLSPRGIRALALVALLVLAPATVGLEASLLAGPVDDNARRTANLAATYEPIERSGGTNVGPGVGVDVDTDPAGGEPAAGFDDAVVFLPTPYGEWLGHPFQALRNDPGLDGPVAYVLDGPPGRDVAVLEALDRTPYRFTYRGLWTGAARPVEPELRRLRVLAGDRVAATTTVGVPAGAVSASVRLETDGGDSYARYRATIGRRDGDSASADGGDGRTLAVTWTVAPGGARVTGRERAFGPATLPVPDGASEVDLVVTFVDSGGASVTYRQELTVEVADGDADGSREVRAIWPPETRVCRLQTACGRESTWIGPDGDYVDGVSLNQTARVANASG